MSFLNRRDLLKQVFAALSALAFTDRLTSQTPVSPRELPNPALGFHDELPIPSRSFPRKSARARSFIACK